MKASKKHVIMKRIILIILLLISFNCYIIKAQTYKLNYEPKGKIVKFNYDSLTFYTDTTSLFDSFKDIDYRYVQAESLNNLNKIRKKIRETKNDTVYFRWIDNDSNLNQSDETYYDFSIKSTLISLIQINKVKLFDKHNKIVKVIKCKIADLNITDRIKKIYINKKTNEELFHDILNL